MGNYWIDEKNIESSEIGVETISNPNEKEGFIRRNRTFLLALLAPALMWCGGLFHREVSTAVNMAWQEPRVIAEMPKRVYWWLKSLGRRGERNQYIEDMKSKKVSQIDQAEFFAKRDYLSGRLSKEESQKCLEGIREHLKKYKKQSKALNIRRNIHDMINNQGRYLAMSDSICSVILNKTGNCVGRSEYMQVMINGIYGNKIESRWQMIYGHQQLIAKIKKRWHVLQKPGAKPLSKKDLDKTISIESNASIKSYIGGKTTYYKHEGGLEIKKEMNKSSGSHYASLPLKEIVKLKDYPGGITESKIDKRTKYEDAQKIAEQRETQIKQEEKEDWHEKLGKIIRFKLLTKKEFKEKERKAIEAENTEFKITPEMVAEAKRTGSIDLSWKNVKDLSPLRGLQLKEINLRGTKVKHIKDLEGMPIIDIDLKYTEVKDTSPIHNAPIRGIGLSKHIKDLNFLRNKPLKDIMYDHDDDIIDFRTYTIVRTNNSAHKGEIDSQNREIIKKNTIKRQKILPDQEGSAKKNTDRECIKFTELTDEIKICLGKNDYGHEDGRCKYTNIKLKKDSDNIWKITTTNSCNFSRVYTPLKAEWDKKRKNWLLEFWRKSKNNNRKTIKKVYQQAFETYKKCMLSNGSDLKKCSKEKTQLAKVHKRAHQLRMKGGLNISHKQVDQIIIDSDFIEKHLKKGIEMKRATIKYNGRTEEISLNEGQPKPNRIVIVGKSLKVYYELPSGKTLIIIYRSTKHVKYDNK